MTIEAKAARPAASGSRAEGSRRRWRENLMPRSRVPDLGGMTVGTWRVLYEETGEGTPYCMCRCTGCGVRRKFPAFKLRTGYVLKCRECEIPMDPVGS